MNFKKNTIFIIFIIIIIIINNAYISTLFLHAFGLQQYVLLSNGFFNAEYIGIINIWNWHMLRDFDFYSK